MSLYVVADVNISGRSCEGFVRMNEFLRLRFSCALLFCTTALTQGPDCKAGCHNGVCERNTGECRCRAGWRGETCDECVPLLGCARGSCAEPGQCVCERGWTGARCDRDIRLCSSNPCSANSSCVEVGAQYICLCPAGDTGTHCQMRNESCSLNSSSCQNGGICINNNGSDNRFCLCPSGFTGKFCEIDICDPNPCKNDGVCTHHDPSFTCVCPPPFSGPVCNISLCSRRLCSNGGTCFNQTDGRTSCFCPPGFTGLSCERHVNKFKSNFRFKARGHLTIPLHTFHKSPRPAERELLKFTMKKTLRVSSSLAAQSQLICLGVLALLTCLVVLVTTGIVFFSRCETWMANVKYSQLVRQQRDFLLKDIHSEDHTTVNIILPETIQRSNYGKHYTSI